MRAENPTLTRVLGGISPIDAGFIATMRAARRARATSTRSRCTDFRSIGTTGRSTNGRTSCDEIQARHGPAGLGVGSRRLHLRRGGSAGVRPEAHGGTADRARAERIHWYSLYDLPRAWPATTRHREAEGSSYYRHFYMGLLREDGTPKLALQHFRDYTPELGICQWFHFEDHRLDDAVRWLRELGVKYICAPV